MIIYFEASSLCELSSTLFFFFINDITQILKNNINKQDNLYDKNFNNPPIKN